MFDYCDVLDPEGAAEVVAAGVKVRTCGHDLRTGPCPKHPEDLEESSCVG